MLLMLLKLLLMMPLMIVFFFFGSRFSTRALVTLAQATVRLARLCSRPATDLCTASRLSSEARAHMTGWVRVAKA